MSENHDHGAHDAPEPAPKKDPAPGMSPEQVLRRTAAAFAIPLPPEDDGHKADGHGGHDAHGGSANLGRNIGMTMAVLGVLLAFSSAMVGGQRTEFVGTMIEQTSATGQFQAVSTKHRVLQAQLQQLHASMPRQPDFDRNEAELVKLEADLAKLEKEQNLGVTLSATVRAMRLETKKIVTTVAPTKEDLLRFARLVRKYQHERETCEKWTESFESCVQLHERAAERYELATLAAEIGIVMASIALLLQNRKTWIIAMLFGAASVTVLLFTGTRTYLGLHETEHRIHEAKKAYVAASAAGDEAIEDEKLLKEVTGEPFDASAVKKPEAAGEHAPPKHGENH
jgi:hypothetical protein